MNTFKPVNWIQVDIVVATLVLNWKLQRDPLVYYIIKSKIVTMSRDHHCPFFSTWEILQSIHRAVQSYKCTNCGNHSPKNVNYSWVIKSCTTAMPPMITRYVFHPSVFLKSKVLHFCFVVGIGVLWSCKKFINFVVPRTPITSEGSPALKFAFFFSSGMRALMVMRKLLLHEFCGLPFILVANVQAPSSFHGISDLITFLMYLLVLLMM